MLKDSVGKVAIVTGGVIIWAKAMGVAGKHKYLFYSVVSGIHWGVLH